MDLKYSKLLLPLAALLLLVAAVASLGAQPRPAVSIPPGQLVDSPNAKMADDVPPPSVPAAPGLPDASAGAITETFDGAPLESWRGITEAPIKWVAKDGRLQQELPLIEGPSDDIALFVTKDTSLADASVESYFFSTLGSSVGLALRGSNDGYYRVTLFMNVNTNQASKAQIERVTPTKTTVLAEAPFSAWPGYDIRQWTLVKATAQGNTITVSVDGREIMSANDDSYASGWAGVWTPADTGASFDNLRIQRAAGR